MLRQKEADIFFSKENEWLICRLKLICNIYNLHNVFRHRINTRKGICYAPVYGVATCMSIRTFISVWQVFVKSWCKLYHFGEPDFTPGCLYGSCCSILVFCAMFVDHYLFFFFWPLCCLSFYDYRIGIIKHFFGSIELA